MNIASNTREEIVYLVPGWITMREFERKDLKRPQKIVTFAKDRKE